MEYPHHFGNHALSLISSLRNRKKIYDLCTGLWGLRRMHSNNFANLRWFRFGGRDHGRIRINGLSHIQIPIKWRPRIGGEAKIRSFVDGFKILYPTLVIELAVNKGLSRFRIELPEHSPALHHCRYFSQ